MDTLLFIALRISSLLLTDGRSLTYAGVDRPSLCEVVGTVPTGPAAMVWNTNGFCGFFE